MQKTNMNFDILEYNHDVPVVTISDLYKQKPTGEMSLLLDFDDLNLGAYIYGTNAKETKIIQKTNCKKLLATFKVLVRAYKWAQHRHINLSHNIYVKNLKKTQNNNDFLLKMMLNTTFCVKSSEKVEYILNKTCDYLDLENETNHTCDFKNNQCKMQREIEPNKFNGCCPERCSYNQHAPCKNRNISCKLFFCHYVIDHGGAVYAEYIPLLHLGLSKIQRKMCNNCIFIHQNNVRRIIRTAGWLELGLLGLVSVLLFSILLLIFII